MLQVILWLETAAWQSKLSTGSRDLLKLFVEDISIIASLFNCEPRNTQAEVMSPSLVAKYHLFASGCMENAS